MAVDIGGTNTRITITTEDIFTPMFEYKFLCSSKETLLKNLNEIEQKLQKESINSEKGFEIKASVLAIAGPISKFGEFVSITNYNGNEEEKEIDVSELPSILFPKKKTIFINDLTGTCLGILALNKANLLPDFFKFGWNHTSNQTLQIDNKHSYLVMAVGTGMGKKKLI